MLGSKFTKVLPVLGLLLASACTTPTQSGWVARNQTDAVTGTNRCVVVKPDAFGGLDYTRAFHLYPVVEKHPKHGVLVGVSTGGNYPVPSGDILWRVDENKPILIKSAETPSNQKNYYGVNISGILSGSTLASGKKAQRMLEQLKQGKTLVFRQHVAGNDIGLPRANTGLAGEYVNGKLQPILLGETFRSALARCGI